MRSPAGAVMVEAAPLMLRVEAPVALSNAVVTTLLSGEQLPAG